MMEDHWNLIEKSLLSVKKREYSPLLGCHFLALEDRRYFNHKGVDYWSSFKALLRYLFKIKGCGGSTIEQQLVRTITNCREVTFKRKSMEILLARKMAKKYEKNFILGAYLTLCFFGEGLIGAERAANKLFKKNCADLDTNEAAFIAALAKFPLISTENLLRQTYRLARREFAKTLLSSSFGKIFIVGGFALCFKGFRPRIFSERLIKEYHAIIAG